MRTKWKYLWAKVWLQFERRLFFPLNPFLFSQHKRIKIHFVKRHSNSSVMSDFNFSVLDIRRKIVIFAIHFFFSHANLNGRYFHQKAFLVSCLIVCLRSLGPQHVTVNLGLYKFCTACQRLQFQKETTGCAICNGTSVHTPSRNPLKFTRLLQSKAILTNLSILWIYQSISVELPDALISVFQKICNFKRRPEVLTMECRNKTILQ